MIPSQHLIIFETFSSFKPLLKKLFILHCSDEIIKIFCNCIFNIKEGRIELKNVNLMSLKMNKFLIEKLCSTRIKLSLKRQLFASQQGTSLLRLLNSSILRYLKLQCYEQQISQKVCTCSRRLILRPRATVQIRQTSGREKD